MAEKYGLAFAGGGGKGSYEIGVWKALKQLKRDVDIVAVSGDSIGAVNALLFANGDFDKAEKHWGRIKNSDYLTRMSNGYCSRDALIKRMNEIVDFDKVSNGPIKCYVNITEVEKEITFPETVDILLDNLGDYKDSMAAEYHKLNGLPKEKIIQLILASTALPVVYQPVSMDGKLYVDGGLMDNCPIRPLIEDAECENLIIVSLGMHSEYDLYLASRAKEIIHIKPSRSLGDLVIDGTLDFDSENVEARIQLGFYDTLRAFDIKERRDMGIPFTEAEKQKRIMQDLDRVDDAVKAKKSLQSAASNLSMYDDLLDKYASRYGIDLK